MLRACEDQYPGLILWFMSWSYSPSLTLIFLLTLQYLISPSGTWINIFVDPGTTYQSDLGDKFTVFVTFRLTTRVWCYYISVIHLGYTISL